MSLRYGVRSDVGHVREGNEDSGYAGPRLVAVADGVGGAVAGEVASRLAIERLAGLDEDAVGADLLGALAGALRAANDDVRLLVEAEPGLAGMSTTVTALLAAGQRLGLVHIGDSRGYLFRGGELTAITRDHTLVRELVEAGEITEEEAAAHPKRSVITRALDGREPLDLDLSVREARTGDRYLLCSDGLSDVVSSQTMAEALALAGPQEAAERLVELALRGGGPDNITAIVADIADGLDDGGPSRLVGAAADPPELIDDGRAGPGEVAGAASSAAGRAALLRRSGGADPEAERSVAARGLGLLRRNQPEPTARSSGRNRGPVLVLTAGVVLVLVIGAVLGVLFVRSQYYVASSGGRVAIFRGVSGSVGPLHLSSVEERSVTVSSLAPEAQRQVLQHIDANDLADARRIVAALVQKGEYDEPGQPTPGGSASPTPTPTPTPTASASALATASTAGTTGGSP